MANENKEIIDAVMKGLKKGGLAFNLIKEFALTWDVREVDELVDTSAGTEKFEVRKVYPTIVIKLNKPGWKE